MNKRKLNLGLIIALTVLLLTNLTPLSIIIDSIIDINTYRLSNYNGSFTSQYKLFKTPSLDKESFEIVFEKYIFEENPKEKEKILYRTFKVNYFHFWRWYAYSSNDIYSLPYMPWHEIEERRLKRDKFTRWQQF